MTKLKAKKDTGEEEYRLDMFKHFNLVWANTPFYNEMIHIEKGNVGPKSISYKRYHLILLVTMMEAFAFQLRQTLLKKHEQGEIRISKKDLPVLNRTKYESYEMFKDTWKIFAKKFYRTKVLIPLFSSAGMQAVQRTYKKRNALTHPKVLEDIKVTDAHYNDSIEARMFFQSLYIKILAGNLVEVIVRKG